MCLSRKKKVAKKINKFNNPLQDTPAALLIEHYNEPFKLNWEFMDLQLATARQDSLRTFKMSLNTNEITPIRITTASFDTTID